MTSNPDRLTRSDRWGALANRPEERETPNNSTATGLEPQPEPMPQSEVWARRLSLILFMLICLLLGTVLAVLPWTLWWSENNLLFRFPALRSIALSPFVKGIVSGLGLIDVWIGIWEAVRNRAPHPN
ncbi:MAG TPA: hypothetical protein VFA76_00450 [Terriglobales bacterium]|nr:hypothetical protein [Terriglobales bacterium]